MADPPCTCSGNAYHRTRFDMACPVHGENGTMIVAVARSLCDRPPAGWWCSREPGHDGPCAARGIWRPERLTDRPGGSR